MDIEDLTDLFASAIIISGQVKLSGTKGEAGIQKGKHLWESASSLAEGYMMMAEGGEIAPSKAQPQTKAHEAVSVDKENEDGSEQSDKEA